MLLSNIIKSAAGTCPLCRQKAGIISRDHPECRRTHDAGFPEMVNLAAEAYKYTDIHGLRQVFHDQLDIVERHWSGRMNAPGNRP